jgi:hypothetical protein
LARAFSACTVSASGFWLSLFTPRTPCKCATALTQSISMVEPLTASN